MRFAELGLVLLFASFSASAVAQTAGDSSASAIELFNGQNLDGLAVYVDDVSIEPTEVWKVEDGMLRCTGIGKGYVRTDKAYADYKLHVEWRWPRGPGNSGVLLNLVGDDVVWPKSFEAQLKADRAGDFALFADARSNEEIVSRNPQGVSTGRLVRPGASAENPLGEWNTYEAVVAGDTITLWVNDRCATVGGHDRPAVRRNAHRFSQLHAHAFAAGQRSQRTDAQVSGRDQAKHPASR
jgi:hypothetical protein